MTGFIDEVDIHVTGGRGGKGCVAFRREKYVPYGGPSGHVVFQATRALNTLSPLRNRGHYRADAGRPGEGSLRHGRSAEDLVILVPAGTLVTDVETGELLADLRDDGERFTVAPGGRG